MNDTTLLILYSILIVSSYIIYTIVVLIKPKPPVNPSSNCIPSSESDPPPRNECASGKICVLGECLDTIAQRGCTFADGDTMVPDLTVQDVPSGIDCSRICDVCINTDTEDSVCSYIPEGDIWKDKICKAYKYDNDTRKCELYSNAPTKPLDCGGWGVITPGSPEYMNNNQILTGVLKEYVVYG